MIVISSHGHLFTGQFYKFFIQSLWRMQQKTQDWHMWWWGHKNVHLPLSQDLWLQLQQHSAQASSPWKKKASHPLCVVYLTRVHHLKQLFKKWLIYWINTHLILFLCCSAICVRSSCRYCSFFSWEAVCSSVAPAWWYRAINIQVLWCWKRIWSDCQKKRNQ